MNQIINMIMRQVMGRLINKGVSIGFDQASKLGKGRKSDGSRNTGVLISVPQKTQAVTRWDATKASVRVT